MTAFDSSAFLPKSAVDQITEIRISHPDASLHAAEARKRRSQLTDDGRLNIIAADHPARRSTRAGKDALRMANRHDLLARVVRVLAAGVADGLLATLDLIEELLIIDGLLRHRGGPSILDEKVLLASLNRGGLDGVCWELDDTWTGPTIDTCLRWNLDGAKALLRVQDDDRDSLATLGMCAQAARDAEAANFPFFLEPLPVERTETGLRTQVDAAALAKLVGVASALGNGSVYRWLKLPACPHFEVVAQATTLPIVILGGAVQGDREAFLGQVGAALDAGENVRGTVIGRNVLYPEDGDPLHLARAIHAMVHENLTAEDAVRAMREESSSELDTISKWF